MVPTGADRPFRAEPLPLEPLAGPADEAARRLLGMVLATDLPGGPTSGIIVETEAYLGLDDPASHAYRTIGRTKRNDAMFGAPGALYVYVSYGMHHCCNVVTGTLGVPSAVLLRALEPLEGLEVMERRRGRATELCSGPGRLAQALGITMAHNRHRLSEPPVRVLLGRPVPDAEVGVSPRIGISKAADWPLRYFVKGHPAVKSPRL